MSSPDPVRLSLALPPAEAVRAVRDRLGPLGWRVREMPSPVDSDDASTTVRLERGRRGLTVLVGALAGRHMAASAQIVLRPAGAGTLPCGSGSSAAVTTLHYLPDSGRALGGLLGERRAQRWHTEAVEALRRP
ncbi:hypothetical protein JSY14_08550 [Brachybacterium sp. EF45031]|uniref:hypothetical protein n=1 Tax=Brachybacterium sillae TaxID=2810536 RepID=UPI00217EC66C|nr:hypothetical protein [Brachybacterium sillae]MCS6712065.1 hypothetical protein [Brachybacterium sillae]